MKARKALKSFCRRYLEQGSILIDDGHFVTAFTSDIHFLKASVKATSQSCQVLL